jgi:hypothetical protein
VEATPVEMTYGTPIRLPGDFFEEQKPVTNLPVFAFKLKEQLRILKPVPTTHHTSRKVFVHPALRDSKFVFIRHDATRTPLQPICDGPYQVLSGTNKHMELATQQANKRSALIR